MTEQQQLLCEQQNVVSNTKFIFDKPFEDVDNEHLNKSKKYFVKVGKMNEELKQYLTNIHAEVYENKRNHSYEVRKYYYNSKKPINGIEKHHEIAQIAKSVLDANGLNNYVDNKYLVEFHQRNCFGYEKRRSQVGFNWHNDDSLVSMFDPVYTILFYLRKDSTVSGGNFRYAAKMGWFKNYNYTLDINEGDVVVFNGCMTHRGQPANGFGCRDVISVFVNRKGLFNPFHLIW